MKNNTDTGKTLGITNTELGVIRSLFELLVKLPSHIRYDTIAWAIERKDPTMMQLVALCRWFGLRGYVHHYFLTPEKFRQSLFAPNKC